MSILAISVRVIEDPSSDLPRSGVAVSISGVRRPELTPLGAAPFLSKTSTNWGFTSCIAQFKAVSPELSIVSTGTPALIAF